MDKLIFEIIYVSADYFTWLLLYLLIFNVKVSVKRNFCGWIGYIVLNLFCAYELGIKVDSALPFLLLLILPLFVLPGKKVKWLILYPVVTIINAALMITLSFFAGLALDTPEIIIIRDSQIMLICAYICLGGLVIVKIHRKISNKQREEYRISKKDYVLFYIAAICALTVLGCVQGLSAKELNDFTANLYGCTAGIVCFLVMILCIWQVKSFDRELKYRKQNEIYEEYIKLQEKHIKESIERDEQMRRFRHDIKGHLAVLECYAKECDNDNMDKYLKRMMEESAIYDLCAYTGNTALDAVIRQQVKMAKKRNIAIEISGNMPQDTLVSVYDICTIITNLISNAIEACEKIEDIGKRWIKVVLYPYESNIFIRVTNAVFEKVAIENNKLTTTKADKRNHGIGSENIAITVSRYNGNLEYSCDDNEFKVEILI